MPDKKSPTELAEERIIEAHRSRLALLERSNRRQNLALSISAVVEDATHDIRRDVHNARFARAAQEDELALRHRADEDDSLHKKEKRDLKVKLDKDEQEAAQRIWGNLSVRHSGLPQALREHGEQFDVHHHAETVKKGLATKVTTLNGAATAIADLAESALKALDALV